MTRTLLRLPICSMVLAAALLAAGCSHVATGGGAWSGYQRWQSDAMAQAQAGAISWSSYYQQSFDRLAALPASLEQDARLEATVNLLSLARKRDAGEIAAAPFEQQRSALEAALERRLQQR